MPALASVQASQTTDSRYEPIVELRFPTAGKYLPADHGYGLLAAMSRLVPEIHDMDRLSILTIPGFADKEGKILLTDRSFMQIRVPIPFIPVVYQLAGKKISIGVHNIQIGIPEISTIKPSSLLRARIVAIKGYMEVLPFLEAVKRQLNSLGIVSGDVIVPSDRAGQALRKTIKIQRFTVVGFTTEISNLNAEDSIKLQEVGIGGKRRMGCGIFLPVRHESHV
jgi:CRISPR-associated protein Cas6